MWFLKERCSPFNVPIRKSKSAQWQSNCRHFAIEKRVSVKQGVMFIPTCKDNWFHHGFSSKWNKRHRFFQSSRMVQSDTKRSIPKTKHNWKFKLSLTSTWSWEICLPWCLVNCFVHFLVFLVVPLFSFDLLPFSLPLFFEIKTVFHMRKSKAANGYCLRNVELLT